MAKIKRLQILAPLILVALTSSVLRADPVLSKILFTAISGSPASACELSATGSLGEAIATLVPRALDVLVPRASRMTLPEDQLVVILQSGANDTLWDHLSAQGARESSLILAETLGRTEIVKALSGARIFASDAQLNLLDLTELVLAKSFFAALNAKNFSEAIRIYDERLPATLRNFVAFRQQLAFCLNRRNQGDDRERAVLILNEILAEGLLGTMSETLSLLARIEKDRFEESRRRGDDSQRWMAHLQSAAAYYRRAFQQDPGNYYPGGNAVELLLVIGSNESVQQAFDMAPYVQTALSRFQPLESDDYWVLATSLQLALVRKNFRESDILLKRLIAQNEPTWMYETTLASLERVEQVVRKLAMGEIPSTYLPSDLAKVEESLGVLKAKISLGSSRLSVAVAEPVKIEVPNTHGLMLDKEIDLQEEARLSSFESRLEELRANSGGVIGIHEFLRRYRDNQNRGYLLGLTSAGHRSVYEALARHANLETWWKAYAKLGLDGSSEAGMTSFMEHITNEQRPVVFMVPRNLFDVETGSNHTAREMGWILEDSRVRAPNIQFVLGGYQIYDESFARGLQARRGYAPSVDFLTAALSAFSQRHWTRVPQ